MPYTTNKELPVYVKKYSNKVQSQFRHVFNTVHASTKDEARAVRAANSILKKRINNGKESHNDNFHYLVDNFLNNLNG